MHRFANPARFLRIANVCYPWLVGALVLSLVVGLYLALVASPVDYQQGGSVRIMYIHVPSAWMAMFVYAAMAIASATLLIWRHPLAGLIAKSSAPIGAAFTFLALLTGSLWGKPMWGTWWVWDARLTSVLILFFLYLGYIALVNAFDNPDRGQKAGAVLALVGAVNLPIIKFSVDWWNTLHQPASVVRMDGPAMHSSMLWPLLIMALAFKLYYLVVLIEKVRTEMAAARLRALSRAALDGR
ncbi:heme ABC transporter permease [Rhodovibrionaceae bacterium A322]